MRPVPGLTAAGQIEQQLHFFFLVLKSGQPDRQQFSNCSWLSCSSRSFSGGSSSVSREVGGLQRFQTALHRRGDGLRAAGDEPLHQDHQEAEVLAVLPHRLVVAEANVLRDRLVEVLLELVPLLPADGHAASSAGA